MESIAHVTESGNTYIYENTSMFIYVNDACLSVIP